MNSNAPDPVQGAISQPIVGVAPLVTLKADTAMTESSIAASSNLNPPTLTRKVRSKAEPEPTPGVTKKIRSAPSALVLAKQAKKDYAAPVGRRVQTMYPVGRPKSKFLQVHPDKTYRQPGVITYKDPDNPEDIYYVSPDLEIPEEYGVSLSFTDLYAGVTHDGTYFIWNVNRSDTTWYRSAQKAVPACVGKWYKVVGRKGPNIYDLYEPAEPIPQPDWSVLPPFDDMLLSAFESRMIEDLNHPLLRKARGYRDADE
jgi:hypothetical protein